MNNISFDENDRIGIIANDAGAANLIKGWIINFKKFNFYFCLDGPALKIFKKEFSLNYNFSLEDILSKCNIIITGTSYSSTLEHNARLKAKKSKVLSIAVIDHWVNYKKRFIRNNKMVLPDQIWVFDEFAEKIVKKTFSNISIKRYKNFYIDQTVNRIKKIEKIESYNKSRVLYTLEPIRTESRELNYPYEFRVLDFFFENINKLNLKNNYEVRFRLHPSEKINKYKGWILEKKRNNFYFSENEFLEDDIAWAEIVVAYESFALVIASASMRRCVTTKLPNEPDCVLKINNLEYLRNKI